MREDRESRVTDGRFWGDEGCKSPIETRSAYSTSILDAAEPDEQSLARDIHDLDRESASVREGRRRGCGESEQVELGRLGGEREDTEYWNFWSVLTLRIVMFGARDCVFLT
jgi:hypothetical protein